MGGLLGRIGSGLVVTAVVGGVFLFLAAGDIYPQQLVADLLGLATTSMLREPGIALILAGLCGLAMMLFWPRLYRLFNKPKPEPEAHKPVPSLSVTGSDHVVSVGQSGGVTARSINFGPERRSLSNENTLGLKAQLLALSREKEIKITALVGKSESYSFAQEIQTFMKENGFRVSSFISSAQFFGPPVVGIQCREEDETSLRITVGAIQ